MPPDTVSYFLGFADEGAPEGWRNTMEVERAGANLATFRLHGYDESPQGVRDDEDRDTQPNTYPSTHTRKTGEDPYESADAAKTVEEAVETGLQAVQNMMDARSEPPPSGNAAEVPSPERANLMDKSPSREPEAGDAVVRPSSATELESTIPRSAETPLQGEAEPVLTGNGGDPEGSTPTPSQALVLSALQDMRDGPPLVAVPDQWERMEMWHDRMDMFEEWKKSSSVNMTIFSVEEVSFNALLAIVSGETSLPELSVMRPEYHPVQTLGTWDWRAHPRIVSEAADMTETQILQKLGVVPRLTRWM